MAKSENPKSAFSTVRLASDFLQAGERYGLTPANLQRLIESPLMRNVVDLAMRAKNEYATRQETERLKRTRFTLDGIEYQVNMSEGFMILHDMVGNILKGASGNGHVAIDARSWENVLEVVAHYGPGVWLFVTMPGEEATVVDWRDMSDPPILRKVGKDVHIKSIEGLRAVVYMLKAAFIDGR